MRLRLCLMPLSAIASMSALALSGCSSTVALRSPPAADLAPAPEPKLPDEALISAAALDQFDSDVLAWGRTEHAKVVRICKWFRDVGVKVPDCEP